MTDKEYDLLCQMGFHCERLSCLAALLDAFEATDPFVFSGSDPALLREQKKYSIRLLTCVSDVAPHYSSEFDKALASIQI